MELKISNVKFLFSALKSMESIDYECHVKLSSEGMEIQGIGPSRVSLFKFVLGDLGDDWISFGIDLIDFGKILNRVKSTKEIIISYDSKSRRMKLKTKIDNKNKTFTLSEVDADVAKIPFDVLLSHPYEVSFDMMTKELTAILEDGQIYSEEVLIGIRNGMLTFRSMGTIGSAYTQLENYTYNNDFATSYSIPHLLSKIDKMRSFPVSLVLGEGLPIYLNYEFDNGYLKIFVAPKVEEDDF